MDETACKDCYDLGLVRAISFDKTFQTLVRCSCIKGHIHSRDLPQWTYNLSKQYTKAKVPPEFFKPDDAAGINSLLEKTYQWGEKIQTAKQYWMQSKSESE